MNNEILQEKEHTKYLGIIIDRNLNWKKHIMQTKLRLSKGIRYFIQVRKLCYKINNKKSIFRIHTLKHKLLFIKLGKCTCNKLKMQA